jgi:hypothetical protein
VLVIRSVDQTRCDAGGNRRAPFVCPTAHTTAGAHGIIASHIRSGAPIIP